ncbi:MAG TPA: hypothetical protein VIQ31_11420 [Phormidium sp.]
MLALGIKLPIARFTEAQIPHPQLINPSVPFFLLFQQALVKPGRNINKKAAFYIAAELIFTYIASSLYSATQLILLTIPLLTLPRVAKSI